MLRTIQCINYILLRNIAIKVGFEIFIMLLENKNSRGDWIYNVSASQEVSSCYSDVQERRVWIYFGNVSTWAVSLALLEWHTLVKVLYAKMNT